MSRPGHTSAGAIGRVVRGAAFALAALALATPTLARQQNPNSNSNSNPNQGQGQSQGVQILGQPVAPEPTLPGAEDFSPPDPLRPDATGRTAPELGVAAEVQLQVLEFGVGGKFRPGDWAPILVQVQDQTDRPRNIVVRFAQPDPDGDTTFQERAIVSNPGVRQPVWLYTRLPFGASMGQTFTITAHEAIERTGTPGTASAYAAGRVLGQTVYPLSQPVSPYAAMVAVVGRSRAGLDQFSNSSLPGLDYAPLGHEQVEDTVIAADRLPDRWMGLAALETIVWTGSGAEDSPSRLSEAQSQALREWIRRGGQLVVVLPIVAQTWVGSAANPLADLRPSVTVERREGVDLGPYRPLLTRRTDATLPRDTVVHAFTPDAGTPTGAAIPLMKGIDGDVVVVRRLVGTGMVTLVGLDLTARGLVDVAGAFEADQFWNRVLGKRTDLESSAALDKLRSSPDPAAANLIGARVTDERDLRIAGAIAKTAQAAFGLLVAFGVFTIYWLLAGPLGFFLLKRRNLKQHAWAAFLVCAVVFTAVGWGGANLLKIRRVEGNHLTFLDHVYGQPNQRMRTWVNLLLPSYGEARVSVGTGRAGTDLEWHQAISPWEAPAGTTGTTFAAFPDARGYSVETRSPDTMSVPSRATVRQFQVDYAGSAPLNWGMIRPLLPEGSSVPLGLELQASDPSLAGAAQRPPITGTLVHTLPGTLRDVHVVLVREPTSPAAPLSPRTLNWMPMTGLAVTFNEWAPNQPLVLDTAFPQAGTRTGQLSVLMEQLRGRTEGEFFGGVQPAPTPGNLKRDLVSLAFFSMIAPPDLTVAGGRVPLLRRQSAHTLDLSRFFTQPCLIIVGILGSEEDGPAECPAPIAVDNDSPDELRPRITGRTVVRWVYPLQPRPVRVQTPAPGQGPIPAE
jgi:hypothetical protein